MSPAARPVRRLSSLACRLFFALGVVFFAAPARGASETPPAPPAAAQTLPFPEAPAGKTTGLEGAYLRTSSSFFNGRISLTQEGWFFTANGRFSRTPVGGFDPVAFATTESARKQDGVYWIEDGKLVLRWARGGKDTTYEFSRDDTRLKIGGIVATPVEGFAPGWRAEVSYEGGGSAGGGAASVSAANSLHLHADGTFGASAAASVGTASATVSAGASSTSSAAGTYHFNGYTLFLRHADGREERRTVFAYGERDANGAPAHLWREGGLLRRRD